MSFLKKVSLAAIFSISTASVAVATCVSPDSAGAIKVYSQPSENSTVLGSLSSGTCGITKAPRCESNYCFIFKDNLLGWVDERYLEEESDPNSTNKEDKVGKNKAISPSGANASTAASSKEKDNAPAAVDGSLTYNVTGGRGLFSLVGGVQHNTPVDAKGQVYFKRTSGKNFVMDLSPITPDKIDLTYKNGIWFGSFDEWGGETMNVLVKVFEVGSKTSTIKMLGKAPMGKLEMTIQMALVGGEKEPEQNEETPSEPSKPASNQGGANKPVTTQQSACDLLLEIETKAREVDNRVLLARIAWIIEEKGLYNGQPLTDRLCDTALEHIEKESILDIIRGKFGRANNWPKDGTASTGKANCDRLSRIEKRLKDLNDEYATDRYAQIKEENGITDLQSASDQACAAAFEQVKRESVEDAVRKAWTPEPSSNIAPKNTETPEKPKVQLGDPVSRPANTCDRLMKITGKSRESGNVFIYQRVRKIMEDLGLIKEAIPNEAECRAALEEIDNSGVVEGLEKRFGPEAQWQAPNNEANNKKPAVIIKDPIFPKTSKKSEAKPSCERLKRVEAQARRSSDPFVTGLIALVKEEQGFVLGQHHSNEQCQKVIDEINKEAAIWVLEKEFGPEDSWKTSTGSWVTPLKKKKVNYDEPEDQPCYLLNDIMNFSNQTKNILAKQLVEQILKEKKYHELGMLSMGGCRDINDEVKKQGVFATFEKEFGSWRKWPGTKYPPKPLDYNPINDQCNQLKSEVASILKSSDKVAKSNLRSAFKQARLVDIGKATAAQCNQVLDALGMPTTPIIGDVTNGAQNPMPNGGKHSSNNGSNKGSNNGSNRAPNKAQNKVLNNASSKAPSLMPANQNKQMAQTPPKPQKSPNSQQTSGNKSKKKMVKIIPNTSKSMTKTNWCGPANNAIIKIVARGSAPEMMHVSDLLNYYQVTNLFTAERTVCEQIFNNLKMNGLVK